MSHNQCSPGQQQGKQKAVRPQKALALMCPAVAAMLLLLRCVYKNYCCMLYLPHAVSTHSVAHVCLPFVCV